MPNASLMPNGARVRMLESARAHAAADLNLGA